MDPEKSRLLIKPTLVFKGLKPRGHPSSCHYNHRTRRTEQVKKKRRKKPKDNRKTPIRIEPENTHKKTNNFEDRENRKDSTCSAIAAVFLGLMSYHSYTNMNAERIISIYNKTKAEISFYESFHEQAVQRTEKSQLIEWLLWRGTRIFSEEERKDILTNVCAWKREMNGWMCFHLSI